MTGEPAKYGNIILKKGWRLSTESQIMRETACVVVCIKAIRNPQRVSELADRVSAVQFMLVRSEHVAAITALWTIAFGVSI